MIFGRHFFEDAVGKAAPRPPRMVRKHEPCRDCTHMLVLDFLEHLKTLPWYEGQVTHLLGTYALSPQQQHSLQGLLD